jgi:hypothetical protein
VGQRKIELLTRVSPRSASAVAGLFGAFAFLGPPAVAPAQEPDALIDPNSPAGTEYAIPLEQARREASPSASASANGVGGSRTAAGLFPKAPLFGLGIRDRSTRAITLQDIENLARSRHGQSPETDTDDEGGAPPASPASAAVGSSSGFDGFWPLGISLLVLLLGTGLGLLLRRGQRRRT